MPREYDDSKATAFNDRVWTSNEMDEARAHILEALRELSDDSRGWGLMPLEQAKLHLAKATANVETMMGWHTEDKG
jgi:hypothetical protein